MTASLEGGEWSAARPGRTLPPGKDPVPILQKSGWAPGPIWTGGKSRPHRDSIPDRPARSQSLYRLSYRAHKSLSYCSPKKKSKFPLSTALCHRSTFLTKDLILPLSLITFLSVALWTFIVINTSTMAGRSTSSPVVWAVWTGQTYSQLRSNQKWMWMNGYVLELPRVSLIQFIFPLKRSWDLLV